MRALAFCIRLPAVLGALALGACASELPDAAASSGEVRVLLDATVPAGAPEGPAIVPAAVCVTVTPPDERAPVSVVLPVVGRVASGELAVERRLAAERWRLRAAAAVGSDTMFRYVGDLELRLDSPRPDVTLTLIFSSRDLGLATLSVAPRDTTIDAGLGFGALATGTDGLGDRFVPAVGWRSRASSVATVDSTGRVHAVAAGQAWIVARSWTGLADSLRVTVR